jgi:phosphohistidine phosphatase SixA
MKKIIVVRHGDYDDDELNEYGRLQIQTLGAAIKSSLTGCTVDMKSSTAKRAQQSSDILAEILGIGYELFGFLWSGADSPRANKFDLVAVSKLILESEADVVILVTHLEYSEVIPTFWARKHLGGVQGFPSRETAKGEAWVIDCEKKTCKKMAPKITE